MSEDLIESEEMFESEVGLDAPDRLSPEWSDFVMTQFTSSELVTIDDKFEAPNVAGLRRVAELLLGQIVSSKVTDVGVDEGYNKAYAVYEVEFVTPEGVYMTFGDAADVHPANSRGFGLKFATACAATRAEARALRKALKLTVVGADEVDPNSITKRGSAGDEKMVTQSQLGFLDRQFKKLNINGKKFINDKREDREQERLAVIKDSLTHEEAQEVLSDLREYSNGANVPKSLTGYVPKWEN